jgi:3-hydroxyisobutyrate dehydrogenase-like beta-hydroxyacid dehydrogenase
MSDQLRVSVIGLGAMGSRMARRLLSAGFAVNGWNRTAAKAEALVADGLTLHPTPREAAAAGDVVITMVWGSEALEGVTGGADGILAGLGENTIYVDMSTVAVSFSIDLAGKVRDRGAWMLDSPVSGSLDAAEEGRLTLVVGGPAAVLDRARPVLDRLGTTVVHVGDDNGLGVTMKLAINLQVALQAVAWGEALAITEGRGVSRGDATGAMLASVVASPMLKYRAPFAIEEPAEVWASAAQLRKDVAYAIDAGPGGLPSAALALEILDEIIADGDGDLEAAELMRRVADRRVRIGAEHVRS